MSMDRFKVAIQQDHQSACCVQRLGEGNNSLLFEELNCVVKSVVGGRGKVASVEADKPMRCLRSGRWTHPLGGDARGVVVVGGSSDQSSSRGCSFCFLSSSSIHCRTGDFIPRRL